MLSDEALLRYNRQILIHEFDVAGQEKLLASHVLVVGLGGLGCPVALYLAASGVGTLTLADGDAVELSNLQRQIAHGTSDIGTNKAASAASAVQAVNAQTTLNVVSQHLGEADIAPLLQGVDLVVDATDNYPIRFALNSGCIAKGIPLVSAGAVRSEGQLAVFDPARGGPCYRCLYSPGEQHTALSCSQSGVLAPLVGTLGSMQAMEAIKLLSGYGEPLRGKIIMLELRTNEIRTLGLAAKEDCPACSHLR